MRIFRCTLLVMVSFTIGLLAVSMFVAHSQSKIAEQPKVISAAAPIFPAIALAARTLGEVVVEIKIDAAGNVTSARAMAGPPLLRKASEIAARRWKFAVAEGSSDARTVRLTFVFRATEKDLPETEITPVFVPPYKVEVTHNTPRIETYSIQ